ncbi:MAG: phosphatase PAP2 family protein [Acidobacteriota bacterium]
MLTDEMLPRGMFRHPRLAFAAVLLGCWSAGCATAPAAPPASGPGGPAAPASAADSGPAEARLPRRVARSVVEEAKRYATDALAFVVAPAKWDGGDWRRAAGAGAAVGVLFVADESIDGFARRQRSRFTDRVSGATTSLGGATGFRIPAVLLVSGIVFSDPNLRDMGRDGLEACLLSSLVTKGIKNLAGRERPFETDGETTFQPLSSRDSFPSGHTTQAFAIASVVAMRSSGWIVPTLAYAAATVVAFDRVNDRVHFASDAVAGAIIGTVTGRFLVARHRRQAPDQPVRVELEVAPIRNGLQARLRF